MTHCSSPPRYQVLALNRVRDMPTRVGLAAFIGLTAWYLAASIWPLVWFGAVCVGQVLDRWIFSGVARHGLAAGMSVGWVLTSLSIALNALVYSAMALYLWLEGGSAGQVFGMIQVAGGLLHVSLSLSDVRAWLLSAVGAHAVYFLGLPVFGAVAQDRAGDVLIVIGALLYMAHLVLAVRQTRAHTAALEAAEVRAREAAARAEAATALKSDFLATLSHEIRTPMNAVVASGHLLSRTRLTRAQAGHVSMLTDAGHFLVSLLDEVLDFSKIEAGKMTLTPAPVDVGARLAALERLWSPKAQERSLGLRLDLDPDLPSSVNIDVLRFQQIVSNLLSNALKFTNAGTVTVAAMWDPGKEAIRLTVTDTGCGIPEDRVGAVFGAFEQADASTTRRYGGTGLGLAISRRLARLMGGDLTVSSRLGEGAVFTLVCPAPAVAVQQPEPTAVSLGLVLTGLRVLVADDHEVNRKILGLYLEPLGCTITFARDGREAVDLARRALFDVILMDMQMPVMDGLEAAAAIRALPEHGATPVVAVTANALDSHREAWRAIGAADFVAKPIDPRQLMSVLQGVCRPCGLEPAQAA